MDQIYWVDANGNEYSMSRQPDIRAMFYRKGAYMPPFKIEEIKNPPQPTGYCTTDVQKELDSTIQRLTVDSRLVELDVIFCGATPSELRQNVRKWASRLNPLKGPGKLKIVAPDGTIRALTCYYEDGFRGEEVKGSSGPTFLKTTLQFRAQDPYWYNASTITSQIVLDTTGTATGFFNDPFFPLGIAQTTIFNEVTLINNGDIECWPIWTIKGPGDTLKITNYSIINDDGTNPFIGFPSGGYAIGDGEIVVIDTRPGQKTVYRQVDNYDLFSSLDQASTFFPLVPGANRIVIELANATTSSYVQYEYNERYLTV